MTDKKLFVYGALKKGYRLSKLLDGARKLADTRTAKPEFIMYDMIAFPVVSRKEEGYYIRGELYAVNDQILEQIDKLEFDAGFHRELVDLKTGDKAYMYLSFINEDYGNQHVTFNNGETDENGKLIAVQEW